MYTIDKQEVINVLEIVLFDYKKAIRENIKQTDKSLYLYYLGQKNLSAGLCGKIKSLCNTHTARYIISLLKDYKGEITSAIFWFDTPKKEIYSSSGTVKKSIEEALKPRLELINNFLIDLKNDDLPF